MRWLAVILLMSTIFCSKLPPPPEASQEERIVPVFEVFGYARCQNCPIVEHATDSLKKLYKDSIAVLEYHLRLLGDTLSPEGISVKTNLYGIGTSAPITVIQGTHRIDGAETDETTQIERFNDYYQSLQLLRDSILLKSLIDTMDDSISITFDADSALYIDTLNSILFIAITEDSVFFPLSGAEDSIYNNVVRELVSLPSSLPQHLSFEKGYLSGKTLIGMIQDTINKNILSITQRRF